MRLLQKRLEIGLEFLQLVFYRLRNGECIQIQLDDAVDIRIARADCRKPLGESNIHIVDLLVDIMELSHLPVRILPAFFSQVLSKQIHGYSLEGSFPVTCQRQVCQEHRPQWLEMRTSTRCHEDTHQRSQRILKSSFPGIISEFGFDFEINFFKGDPVSKCINKIWKQLGQRTVGKLIYRERTVLALVIIEGDPPGIRIPGFADTIHRFWIELDLRYNYIICSKSECISDRQEFPHVDTSFQMAGVPGFEPELPDPKSGDLPLVDTPVCVRLVLRWWNGRLLLLIGVRGFFIGAGLILLSSLFNILLSFLFNILLNILLSFLLSFLPASRL